MSKEKCFRRKRQEEGKGLAKSTVLMRLARLSPVEYRYLYDQELIAPDVVSGNHRMYQLETWLPRIEELRKDGRLDFERRPPKRIELPPSAKRVKVTYTAEQSTAILRLLKQDVNPVDIAIELQMHPSIIYNVMRDYAQLQGGIYIDGEVLALLNEVPLDGTFPITTAQQIVELIMSAVREVRCLECDKKRRSSLCRTCLAGHLTKARGEDTDNEQAAE